MVGATLLLNGVGGRIVETEAYRPNDRLRMPLPGDGADACHNDLPLDVLPRPATMPDALPIGRRIGRAGRG